MGPAAPPGGTDRNGIPGFRQEADRLRTAAIGERKHASILSIASASQGPLRALIVLPRQAPHEPALIADIPHFMKDDGLSPRRREGDPEAG